jgi:RND superfamily putative drug exporter
VLISWVAAVVVVSAIGGAVGASFSQSFSQPGTDSQRAADLLSARFPSRAGDEGQIVFSDSAGIDAPEVRSRMEQLFAEVATVKSVTGVGSPYESGAEGQISKDGMVAYATVQFDKLTSEVPKASATTIIHLGDRAAGRGLRIELGGRVFEQNPSVGPAEAIGLLAAIVILLISFGSLIAMGLPIMTALVGISIGVALTELLTHVIGTPDFTTQLVSMIGIGVGIDYALFIVTRYRQGLHDGYDPETAVTLALDTAGRAVIFAGCTVVIAILGLFLMGVSWVQGMAIGVSITVALVMAASVTLLPAVLGFAGHKIEKLSLPGVRKHHQGRASLAFRWSRVVQHRPWAALLASLALLVLLAVPFFSIQMGFADAGSDPAASTTRQAYDVLAKGFGAGSNGPLILAADLRSGQTVDDLQPLVESLRSTKDVASVGEPVASPDANAAVIRVIPTSSPQSQSTVDLVTRLRDHVVPNAIGPDGPAVYIGGLTAASIDTSDKLSTRLPWFIGGVLALSFLLLLLVFRSVLVPVKAVIMNLLSIGASFGVIVAVFQWGWFGSIIGIDKAGPIAPFFPMLLFAIVFGLSMDYEVFLLSRIREEYDRTHDNALAVADGLAATARVITAAALIMVTVFGSFVFGDSPAIKIFGLGLASAIFIDATIVRMVLVPATMELLGDLNWWFPHWLRRLPQFHVEPALHPPTPAPVAGGSD